MENVYPNPNLSVYFIFASMKKASIHFREIMEYSNLISKRDTNVSLFFKKKGYFPSFLDGLSEEARSLLELICSDNADEVINNLEGALSFENVVSLVRQYRAGEVSCEEVDSILKEYSGMPRD